MKISVLIPVYNVEKYIRRCIESILSQSLQDFEIIFINDASTDASMDIVREFVQKDSRFIIFENEENMGPMWTRMLGYTNASGDYLVFCDADDYMPSDALELLYNAIIKDKSDIVCGAYTYIDINDSKKKYDSKLTYGRSKDAVYRSLLSGELTHSLWAKIFDRKLFENYSYTAFKNYTYTEDGILLYEIINNVKKVSVIEDSVYNYLQNTSSITNTRLSDNSIISNLHFWRIQYNYISKDKDLLKKIAQLRFKNLLTFMKRDYDKKLILDNLKYDFYRNLFSFRSALRYSDNLLMAFYNYTIMNSRIARKIKNKLGDF